MSKTFVGLEEGALGGRCCAARRSIKQPPGYKHPASSSSVCGQSGLSIEYHASAFCTSLEASSPNKTGVEPDDCRAFCPTSW